jgi:hypothetical protein
MTLKLPKVFLPCGNKNACGNELACRNEVLIPRKMDGISVIHPTGVDKITFTEVQVILESQIFLLEEPLSSSFR